MTSLALNGNGGGVSQIVRWFREFREIILTVTVVGGAVWILVRPTLEPYQNIVDTFDTHNTLQEQQFARIEGAIKDIQIEIAAIRGGEVTSPVQYRDIVYTEPSYALPGERIRLMYVAKRMTECQGEIEHRWIDVSSNTLMTEFVTRTPLVTFPITQSFEIFFDWVIVPPTLPVGSYLYRPMVRCEGLPSVVRPPAFIHVVQQRQRFNDPAPIALDEEGRPAPY